MPAVLPGNLFAQENTKTLRIGLVGCGGRGSGAANNALAADKNIELVAMGDAFEDRIQSSLKNLKAAHGDKVKVTPEKCFVGLDAYQKVIDSGVDVVLLATPPGFRPQHLKAAIDAGKHVFTEKPMATDGSRRAHGAGGCRRGQEEEPVRRCRFLLPLQCRGAGDHEEDP